MAQLRTLAVPVGVLAAVLLFLLVNPWIVLEGAISQIVTIGFWASFILLLIILISLRDDPDVENIEVEGPAFTRYLFNNPRAGLFWLPIRLFVGFQWLEAGWHKVQDPAWVGADAGTAILGFWTNAVAIPEEGRPSITYEWYRTFLQFLIDSGMEQFFSYAIAFGELFVGIGLLVGALVGIAAFFGALMNMSFLLAGSGLDEPDHVHARRRADARLEGRRLLRPGSLPAAAPRDAVEAAQRTAGAAPTWPSQRLMGEEAYPYGDALIPEQFDERTVIFLVRPPDAPEFSEEELDRLQIEHLTHLRSLKRRGVLLANGPLDDQTDVSYRGIGIYGVPLDEALALANTDPMVKAGRLAVKGARWFTAAGEVVIPREAT